MDINFLPDKGKKNEPSEDKKDKKKLEKETEWSEPGREQEGLIDKLSKGAKRGIKSYLPGFFSANFFKKKKGTEPMAVYPNNLADKKKLKESRKEVLKFVKEQKKEVSYPPRPEPNKPPEAKTASPTKKKMAWLKFKNLFNPLVGIIKKLGKKTSQPARPALAVARPASLGEAGEAGPPLAKKQASQPAPLLRWPAPLLRWPAPLLRWPAPLRLARPGRLVRLWRKSQKEKIREDKQPPVKKEEIAPEFSRVKSEKEEAEAEILETNLIKGEITVFFNWRKNLAILFIGIILSALAVGVVYGGLAWWGSQKEKESQYFAERFVEVDKEISRVEEGVREISVFKKKLSLANSLLDQHIYWTNFFKFLEENTLADVYYLGFFGDNKGKYNLSANVKDFSAIQAQVEQMLASEYVLGASVDQAGIATSEKKKASDTGEISFELKLLLDPAIFTK